MSTTVDRQPPQVVLSSRRAWVINSQTGIVGYSLTLTVTLNGGAYSGGQLNTYTSFFEHVYPLSPNPVRYFYIYFLL